MAGRNRRSRTEAGGTIQGCTDSSRSRTGGSLPARSGKEENRNGRTGRAGIRTEGKRGERKADCHGLHREDGTGRTVRTRAACRTDQRKRLGRADPFPRTGRPGRSHEQSGQCAGHASRHATGDIYGQDTIAGAEREPAADSEYRGGHIRQESDAEDVAYRLGRSEPAEQGGTRSIG